MMWWRFQLAAERGNGLGLLLCPLDCIRKPCWGALSLQARRAPTPEKSGLLHVVVLKVRGAHAEGTELTLDLAWNDG